MKRPYRLSKSRKIFYKYLPLYNKRWKKLSPTDCARAEEDLEALDTSLVGKNRAEASERAKKLDTYGPKVFKKHPIRWACELIVAIALALAAATVIRQMWFEPMEIPSGSMRPHFQELDRLVITKTPFGLNIPMTPHHFFFSPEWIQRTGVFIFTAEDMDIPDQDTTYFLLPGKKRLIKRVMGKPGDILYFYGGKIYGIDREGNELTELRAGKWADGVTSIPFIHFQGKQERTSQAILYKQMNQPLGRTFLASRTGQIALDGKWVDERPGRDYSTLWGMGNYAIVRLLTPEQAIRYGGRALAAPLTLQIAHHPTLTGGLTPQLSLLPLTEEQIENLMAHMTTSRFIIKGGRAYAEATPQIPMSLRPSFPQVPDGRYQFTDGKAYKVAFSGVLIPLKPDHPLYSNDPAHIQKLCNFGIDFNTAFEPTRFEAPFPNRYAFYREGDLYLLAHPLIPKGSPNLAAFEEEERSKRGQNLLYQPFIDQGPPIKEGKIDKMRLKTFGLKVPEKGYLALGDNYANSGDSRVFGFVPEDNIRGAPAFIFWPPGKRWGKPFMPPNPWITPARLTVWTIAAILTVCWLLWVRRRNRTSHFKRLSR